MGLDKLNFFILCMARKKFLLYGELIALQCHLYCLDFRDYFCFFYQEFKTFQKTQASLDQVLLVFDFFDDQLQQKTKLREIQNNT